MIVLLVSSVKLRLSLILLLLLLLLLKKKKWCNLLIDELVLVACRLLFH